MVHLSKSILCDGCLNEYSVNNRSIIRKCSTLKWYYGFDKKNYISKVQTSCHRVWNYRVVDPYMYVGNYNMHLFAIFYYLNPSQRANGLTKVELPTGLHDSIWAFKRLRVARILNSRDSYFFRCSRHRCATIKRFESINLNNKS